MAEVYVHPLPLPFVSSRSTLTTGAPGILTGFIVFLGSDAVIQIAATLLVTAGALALYG